MKKLSFSLTDSQFQELKDFAEKKHLSVTDAIIFYLPVTKTRKLTLEIVLNRLTRLKPTAEFSIPSIFEKCEWDNFEKGSKLSVGRQFFTKDIPGKIFVGKNSANLAQYLWRPEEADNPGKNDIN